MRAVHSTPTFRVMLRVYAEESDLDVEKVRRVIKFDSEDPAVKSLLMDEDEEVLAIEFASPLTPSERVSSDVKGVEQAGNFKAAVTWLRARTEDPFRALKEMGLAYDLFVEGYTGPIGVELLRELSRLGVGLWIAPVR